MTTFEPDGTRCCSDLYGIAWLYQGPNAFDSETGITSQRFVVCDGAGERTCEGSATEFRDALFAEGWHYGSLSLPSGETLYVAQVNGVDGEGDVGVTRVLALPDGGCALYSRSGAKQLVLEVIDDVLDALTYAP